jgi:hypothetical protein
VRTLLAPAFAATSLALALAGAPALAEPASGGLVVTGDFGVGGELGLDAHEKATVVELEVNAGWEFAGTGVRPELGVALGFEPDTSFALRPGLRWTLPDIPIQLRAALDWSNSRGDFHWRWLLLGAAVEVRLTDVFGLFAGVDSGVPLSNVAGVPLLVRGGASFRL